MVQVLDGSLEDWGFGMGEDGDGAEREVERIVFGDVDIRMSDMKGTMVLGDEWLGMGSCKGRQNGVRICVGCVYCLAKYIEQN